MCSAESSRYAASATCVRIQQASSSDGFGSNGGSNGGGGGSDNSGGSAGTSSSRSSSSDTPLCVTVLAERWPWWVSMLPCSAADHRQYWIRDPLSGQIIASTRAVRDPWSVHVHSLQHLDTRPRSAQQYTDGGCRVVAGAGTTHPGSLLKLGTCARVHVCMRVRVLLLGTAGTAVAYGGAGIVQRSTACVPLRDGGLHYLTCLRH